jgi:glycosyltransferase involved in cell wall biosynthesis
VTPTVHFVLPNDIDDPLRPSGGNIYDRRLIRALSSRGWRVREHAVAGDWPWPDPAALGALARVLARLSDGDTDVVDGLVASTAPDVLAMQAPRLRLVVVVHMPLGDTLGGGRDGIRAMEESALSAAFAVVTTSQWCRARLLELYDLNPHRVHVAEPGVDGADLATATQAGSRLLCVAAVTHHKGHDVLLRALSSLEDLAWSCVCVGTLAREPAFVADLRRQARRCGIDKRLRFVGPLTGKSLKARYAAADLLVLPSRGETYGMVVTEALTRGVPVVATAAKGLPEAVGRAPDGSVPGLLVPADDAGALAEALRRWLAEPEIRHRLRAAAWGRRGTLPRWAKTADAFTIALARISVHSGVFR